MSASSDDTRLIRALRLRNQGLVDPGRRWESAGDVARGMLATQAQDIKGIMLGISVRARSSPTEETVAAAFATGEVVRNRPSRGTLQVTAPEDLHWLSALCSPRSNAAAVKRREQIGVSEKMTVSVGEVLREELADGVVRTRPELVAACSAAGIELDGTQAGHLLRHYTETMLIVVAGSTGRVDSFTLADGWLTERRAPERPEALAELAVRYFATRGPATLQCLGWWANLTMGDVRTAVEAAGSALEEVELGGTSFIVPPGSAERTPAEVEAALAEPLLLPPFDEYLLGYRSRDAVITSEQLDAVVPGRNGMFKPIVVVDGAVIGLWSRKATSKRVTVTVEPFGRFPSSARAGLQNRVDEYGAFLGLPASMIVGPAFL